MNPCASKFTPISTAKMEPSSPSLALENDLHGSASVGAGVFGEHPEHFGLQAGLHSHALNHPLTPHPTPFHAFSSVYPSMPLNNYVGLQPSWSVPIWYNPVAVAGPHCPTPPHPPPTAFPFGSIAPALEFTDETQKQVTANPRARFGGLFDHEQTKASARRRPPRKKAPHDVAINNHRENSFQKPLPSSKPLTFSSSSVKGKPIVEETFEFLKGAEVNMEHFAAARRTRELKQPHGYSDHNVGSCFSKNLQQDLTYSNTPSPPCSETGVPLFSDTLHMPSNNPLDTLGSLRSLYERTDSVSPYQHDRELGLQTCIACRSHTATGSSRPRKTSSQETEPLPTLGMKAPEYKPAQPALRIATEISNSETKADSVRQAIRTDSDYTCTKSSDLYAIDDEWVYLDSRRARNSAPEIPSHSKLPKSRNVSRSSITALKRSTSVDGGNANDTRKTSHKGAFNAIKGPMQSNNTIRVSEGSWSQSKRWMSQNTKERMAFQKMWQNLHHIRADKSPFVPQNPLELTAFRAEVAETTKRRLSREVNWRMATFERRKAIASDPDEQVVEVTPFLLGKEFKDGLSPVFASPNCFAKDMSEDNAQCARWPSLAELKAEGDKRPGRYERYFPPPKLTINVEKGAIPTMEGWVGAEMRVVKPDTRFIQPVTPVAESAAVETFETAEVRLEKLPGYLQAAIMEMEQEFNE